MKNLLTLTIGSYRRGLWYDDIQRGDRKSGWGIKLDIIWGKMVRPISLKGNNPWKNPDFILKCPFIGLFFSIAFGQLGFYIGFKSFKNYKGRYDWLPSNATSDKPEILFTPSATIRRTRIK